MSDMIKIKRKNYIQEKAQERFDNDHIGISKAISLDKFEDKWRAKFKRKNYLTLTEDNYQINQILKNFQSNKDQINGFSSKYIQQLSDLLGQKDKNFTKKRLELYNNRINKINSNIIESEEKYNLKTYSSLSNINSKLNRMFNSKKSDTVAMFLNNCYKKSQSHNFSKKIRSFTIQSKSEKMLFSKSKRKNFKNKNKVNESIAFTQLGFNEDDDNSYDNLIKGIKLFKNIQNDKYFENQKKITIKSKLINKITREKDSNDLILPKFLISKKLKSKKKPKNYNNKQNFYEDCKKIYLNVKKKLDLKF